MEPDDIRARIVAEARTWIGTPWVHQGRTKGTAADCVAIISEPCRALGLAQFDMRDYERWPTGQLLKVCAQAMHPIAKHAIQPADAVVMDFGLEPHHIALVTPYSLGTGQLAIVHSVRDMKVVCEHRLSPEWRRCIVAAFRLPGVPAE